MKRTLVGVTNYHEQYNNDGYLEVTAVIKIIDNFVGGYAMYPIMEPLNVSISSFWSEPNITSHRLNEIRYGYTIGSALTATQSGTYGSGLFMDVLFQYPNSIISKNIPNYEIELPTSEPIIIYED